MGEGEKTVKIMKKIAKMNGKKVHLEKKYKFEVCQRFLMRSMTQSYPLPRSKNLSGQTREEKIFFENNPNSYSKDPTELLGPLPYKRNEDHHHSHHHSLDAHKVGFKIYNDHLNSQIHFSMEFDCTVRNIKNLDFSIYVSFCVSHLEINTQL